MSLTDNQLAADNFTRPNENPLNNGVWTTIAASGPLQIVSDVVEDVNDATGGACKYTGVSFPADQWAEVRIRALAAGGAITIALRCSDDFATKYSLYVSLPDNAGVTVIKGGFTTLATLPITPAVNDVWRFGIFGDTWYVFQNGVQVASGTDSDIASGNVVIVIDDGGDPSDTALDAFAAGSITDDVVTGPAAGGWNAYQQVVQQRPQQPRPPRDWRNPNAYKKY